MGPSSYAVPKGTSGGSGRRGWIGRCHAWSFSTGPTRDRVVPAESWAASDGHSRPGVCVAHHTSPRSLGVKVMAETCTYRSTRLLTELGVVELSKINWLKTGVLTTSEGHRLDVETRLAMDPAEVREIVGVKVEQVD